MILTPELVLRLIEISDNKDPEPREIASKAIQYLIQKYQNKIFSSYLKHFLTHFEKYPKGVAFALRTVCESASRNLLVNYSGPIIQILEVLLKSDDVDFLHNAGGIFNDLFNKTNIEKPDPAVLELLYKMIDYPNACKELLSFKNESVTKALLPKIMTASKRNHILPLVGNIIAEDLFNTIELVHLFPKILKEYEEGEDLLLPIQIIISSITEASSLHQALSLLQDHLSNEKKLQVLNYFAKNTNILYAGFIDRILEMTLINLSSSDPVITNLLAETVKKILSIIKKEQYPDYFKIFKEKLNIFKEIPLFNKPKGLKPFLILIQNSLKYGNIETKELAARSYSEIIDHVNQEVLQKYTTKIVGPLLRVLSQKVPGDVNLTIIDALYLLLQKAHTKLTKFVPYLQSAFTKSLKHDERNVRESSGRNIIELLKLSPRIDLFVYDLIKLKGSSEVIVKSLSVLQKIIENSEMSQQLLLFTSKKLLSQVSTFTTKEVALEIGKLLCLINTDVNFIIQTLKFNYPSVIIISEILSNSSPAVLISLTSYIENAFKSNYEDTLKLLEIVGKAYPQQVFDVSYKFFFDISKNILPALNMLAVLPSDRFTKNPDFLIDILPALACECVKDKLEEFEENLKNTVKKIFNTKEKGIKNALRAFHLLDENMQKKFKLYLIKIVK